MARARQASNGQLQQSMTELNHAMATLVQTQAAFVAQKAETDREMAQINREMTELKRTSDERFARIEAILMEHGRILRALPEAIREKIGFKVPEKREPTK